MPWSKTSWRVRWNTEELKVLVYTPSFLYFSLYLFIFFSICQFFLLTSFPFIFFFGFKLPPHIYFPHVKHIIGVFLPKNFAASGQSENICEKKEPVFDIWIQSYYCHYVLSASVRTLSILVAISTSVFVSTRPRTVLSKINSRNELFLALARRKCQSNLVKIKRNKEIFAWKCGSKQSLIIRHWSKVKLWVYRQHQLFWLCLLVFADSQRDTGDIDKGSKIIYQVKSIF